MANPAAPRELDTGAKIWNGIYDNAGADAAALFRIVRASAIDDETTPSGSLAVADAETPLYAAISAASSGDNTLVVATADKKIAVWSILAIAEGDVDVRFEDGAGGTAFSGQMHMSADGAGFAYSAGGLVPLFVCSTNTLLNLELSAAVQVSGTLAYTLID